MSNYKAGQIKDDANLKEVIERLNTELRLIEQALEAELRLPTLSAEPPRPRDGTVAYADGVAWDPGSGAGLYVFVNGAWVATEADLSGYQPLDPVLTDISDGEWTPTNGLELTGSNLQLTTNQRTVGLSYVISNSPAVLTTGDKNGFRVPFACTIQSVTMGIDVSGSIVVDIWKDTHANYPPVNADSITASATPTISSTTNMEDTTLTGWTTSIAAGDWLFFNIDSVTSATKVSINLKVLKT